MQLAVGASRASTAPANICNRDQGHVGMQLEILRSLRHELAGDVEKLSRCSHAVCVGIRATENGQAFSLPDKRGAAFRLAGAFE